MKIGVFSICKNEEDMIRPWMVHLLEDADPVHDLYITDTGSTDKTLEYIDEVKKNYHGRKIVVDSIDMSEGFAVARNKQLLKYKDQYDWILMLDIDELFCNDYYNFFEKLSNMDYDGKFDSDAVINIPHIKFWDFDRLWFHKYPTNPSINVDNVIYSEYKDTICLIRPDYIKGYEGKLHERLQFTKPYTSQVQSLMGNSVVDIHDLQNDVFVGHYSKAKLHAMSKRTGMSFEWCVGKKRMEFRRQSPVTYFGRVYDAAWCEHATDKDIEQLGKDQLKQFIEVEGHTFRPDFNAYELNNVYIKEYF